MKKGADLAMVEKTNIHVICSVKGGCGKTAFSMFKAMELSKKERKRELKNCNGIYDLPVSRTLWIDADLKGTSSKTLFYGENEEKFNDLNSNMHIDDLKKSNHRIVEQEPIDMACRLCFPKGFNEYSLYNYLREDVMELNKIIVHGYLYHSVMQKKNTSNSDENNEDSTIIQQKEREVVNGGIDLIFSSPEQKEKSWFSYGSLNPFLGVGQYNYKMQSLLNRMITHGGSVRWNSNVNNGKPSEEKNGFSYNDIIIDMPPGEDAYAEALLRIVREMVKRNRERLALDLYVVTTSDRGHREAMIDNIRRLYEESKANGYIEKIQVVLNEIRNSDFTEEIKDNIVVEIGNIIDCPNTKIVFSPYNSSYHDFCNDVNTMFTPFESHNQFNEIS